MAISESTSVAEIATASLAAARVLEQNGIDPRHQGNQLLADVCREKNLDASAVSAGIERANAENPPPDWTTAPLSSLIAHIVSTHHEFLRRELPLLTERLAKVAEVYGEREQNTMARLPDVLQELTDELSLHIQKEEMMLFPTIEAYEAAAARGMPLPPTPFGSVANPIRMIEIEHEHVDSALLRMRELTSGYAIPGYACVTYAALMNGLCDLEADLQQHIHLENDILFPRAVAIECERGRSAEAAL
jgi:regulator of cell morphogenesis and NO signaling